VKLESKLGISSGVLILAMFVSAFTADLRIDQANRLSANVANGRIPIICRAREVRSAMMISVRSLQSYMLFGTDPASSQSLRRERAAELAAADQPLAQLLELTNRFDLGPDAPRIQEIQTGLVQLRSLEEDAERLNELHTPEGNAEAMSILRDRILPLDPTLFASMRMLISNQEQLCDADMARLALAHRVVLVTLWGTTLLGAVLGGILSTLLARRIARGIDLVAARAIAIAAGDLTGAPLDIDSRDQVGALALAMQQMQSGLAAIIGTVAHTAGAVTSSAASMSSASEQIHRRVDQQAQKTQQAATAMQEMSASIAEVSRHTQSAAETARSAAGKAHEGGAIVKQMLASMESIAAAVNDTSTTIGLLGEDSRRISQIVTVIDEIARKTNLLALNAAIEAARAGEQGRGFAVVAGEVRHLAESTATATGEISAMIKGVQDRTRSAIASMASGTATVEQGVVTTNQAGEALERIIGLAERVDRMIAQIAIAASQQAAAADQSSASLDAIHTLSHGNLAEMSTATAGIEGLRTTAAALESQVERFRLRTPPTPTTPRSPQMTLGPKARPITTRAPHASPRTIIGRA